MNKQDWHKDVRPGTVLTPNEAWNLHAPADHEKLADTALVDKVWKTKNCGSGTMVNVITRDGGHVELDLGWFTGIAP